MGTWNWLHKMLIEPENTNPISIKYLIKKGVNPILKDEYNMAPLNWAMANGKNIEAAKILLKAGGDTNLADKGVTKSYVKTILSLMLSSAIILTLGALVLSLFVTNKNVLMIGVLPFLPGDALKSTAVTLLVPTLWKFVPKNDK